MSHTTAPWVIADDGTIEARFAGLVGHVANVSQANARLIAAAPDLLEALLDALPYVEDVLDNPEQLACFKAGTVQRHAKAIRAAIAKATGEVA
jgi:hypothetical protein